MEIGEQERRVSAGYQFLLRRLGDEAVDRIDFSLDVADADFCPLSLATGKSYSQARYLLGISAAEAIELGFSFRSAYALQDIDLLNATWRKKILRRNRER